jgi:predicted O-methyltransferase YrrM
VNDQVKAEMTPQAIIDTVSGFQKSRAILTGFELGIFTVLNDEWKSSQEVAEAIEGEARGTDRLMNALVGLGLLEKRNGRFANSPTAARLLVKGKPDYMAGLGHSVNLWDTWSGLTAAVRRGGPAPRPPIENRAEDWVRAFIGAMHGRARQQGPEIVRMIDLTGVSRVLDVGGGSGAFSMAFVRAASGITAVVFDLPNVVRLTRTYVESEGFADRVETVAGDYVTDDLPGGFDLVFLSAIVHSNSPGENLALVRKAAAALNPGGRLAIIDFLMDEDRSGPLSSALFALNMLVGTERGDTYTEAEIRGWMAAAGLGGIRRADTPFHSSLMIGRA